MSLPLPLVLASSFTEVRPGLIFWTLVTFFLVALLLRRVAWGPILNIVDERERQINNAIESAKRERAEAEKLLADQKTAIAEARREAAEMMRKNHEDVDRLRNELLAKARAEAEAARNEATRAIADEKAKAVNDVKRLTADLAIQIAEKLLGEKMDDARQRSLAQQYIEQLSAKPVEGPVRV